MTQDGTRPVRTYCYLVRPGSTDEIIRVRGDDHNYSDYSASATVRLEGEIVAEIKSIHSWWIEETPPTPLSLQEMLRRVEEESAKQNT